MTKTLNTGQAAAADAFFEFLFDDDQREMSLSGPGGVGKTFLMSFLIDNIIPRYQQACKLVGVEPRFNEVFMTATTNKAAEVLAVATQRPTSTVHSFLGLKVKDNYSTGKSTIERTNSWTVRENIILFVDECSMIDSQLLAYIREGLLNSKIVYVGDHCQLPPVMEASSPIYTKNMPTYELTEQMRTNNPDLQALNDQLRNTVETGVFKPIQIIPGVIDHLNDEQMAATMESVLMDNNHESRALAYTNKRVIQFNDHIRFMRNLPDEWQVGESLINNSAIRHLGEQISVEEELELVSASDTTEKQYIVGDPEGFFETRRCNFKSKIGHEIPNLNVPVDPVHYLALIKFYASQKNWQAMYFLKNNFPDLRQRDAATFHKVQGSSHDSVFIDLGDLSTCRNPDVAARMLYVAASRARYRIFLYGELASKFGGIRH